MDRTHSPRPVLGNVSPNIKSLASTPAFMKRNVVGSPLKRTSTAAVDDEIGFKYLKRRRLGDEEVLSEMGGGQSGPRQELLLELSSRNPSTDIQFIEPSLSPTEPNTPSEDEDDVTQGSSAERRSFSSLINYDPSSQTSNAAGSAATSAEMLRLRLRIAMYKVRTNQIESSFRDLKDEMQCRESARRKAIDDAVAELRAEARDVLARSPNKNPLSMPPTSSSTTRDNDPLLHPSWPRSLLVSTSPEKLSWPIEAITPPHTNARYSQILEPELTSSVVRGRVAEGLLGLRNAF